MKPTTPHPPSSILHPRPSPLWSLQSRLAPLLFLTPFLLVFTLFLAYPLYRSFLLSLHQSVGPRHLRFIGLSNYLFLLHDWMFWWSLANTLLFTILFLAFELPLSLALALLLNSPKLRAKSFFRYAFFSTHLTGQVFVAILFSLLLDTRAGLLNRLLSHLGIPPISWLTDPKWILPSTLLAALWLSVGFAMIFLLASLQSVDPELHDAAKVDGATPLSSFWHVTLPSIRPVLLFLTFSATVLSLQLFELPYILHQGPGPGARAMTLVMYTFLTAFDAGDLGYASALAWTLLLLTLLLTLITLPLTKRHLRSL